MGECSCVRSGRLNMLEYVSLNLLQSNVYAMCIFFVMVVRVCVCLTAFIVLMHFWICTGCCWRRVGSGVSKRDSKSLLTKFLSLAYALTTRTFRQWSRMCALSGTESPCGNLLRIS